MCIYPKNGSAINPTTPKPNDKKRLGVFLPAGLLFSSELSSVLQQLDNRGSADPVDTLYIDVFSSGTDHLQRAEFSSQVVPLLKQWRGAGSNSGLLNYKKRIFAWYRMMHWGSTTPPQANWLLKPDTGTAADNWLTPYFSDYTLPAPPAKPQVPLCQQKTCTPNVYIEIAGLVKKSVQTLNANSLFSSMVTGIHLDELRAPSGPAAAAYQLTLAAQSVQIREALACMACEILTAMRLNTTARSISISQLNLQNTACLEDTILPAVKFDEIIPIVDDLLNNPDPHPDLSRFDPYNILPARVIPQVNMVNNQALIQGETLTRLYKEAHQKNGIMIGLCESKSVSYTEQVKLFLQMLTSTQKQVVFTVADDMGKPVANAQVNILDQHQNNQYLQTDAHGIARLNVVEAEEVTLRHVTATNKQVKKQPVIN